jgi:hypothetical protein
MKSHGIPTGGAPGSAGVKKEAKEPAKTRKKRKLAKTEDPEDVGDVDEPVKGEFKTEDAINVKTELVKQEQVKAENVKSEQEAGTFATPVMPRLMTTRFCLSAPRRGLTPATPIAHPLAAGISTITISRTPR